MPLDQVQEKTEKKLQPCSQKEGRSLLLNSPGHMESSSQGSSRGGSAEISNRNVEYKWKQKKLKKSVRSAGH